MTNHLRSGMVEMIFIFSSSSGTFYSWGFKCCMTVNKVFKNLIKDLLTEHCTQALKDASRVTPEGL